MPKHNLWPQGLYRVAAVGPDSDETTDLARHFRYRRVKPPLLTGPPIRNTSLAGGLGPRLASGLVAGGMAQVCTTPTACYCATNLPVNVETRLVADAVRGQWDTRDILLRALGVQGYAACHIALNFPTTLQLGFRPISSIRIHRATGQWDRSSTPGLRGEANSGDCLTNLQFCVSELGLL